MSKSAWHSSRSALNGALGDLRYASRSLFKSPALVVVIACTLALGIGANSIVFAVVNAVLIRPLPFKESENLIKFRETNVEKHSDQDSVSFGDFLDWQENSSSFAGLGAYVFWQPSLTGSGEPEELSGVSASQGLLTLLQVKPYLGRLFTPQDDERGAPKVVLFSYGLWFRRYGSGASVIGTSVTLDGESYTLIGVLPPDLQSGLSLLFKDAEVWRSMSADADSATKRQRRFLRVLGCLKSEVSIQKAQAELDTINASLQAQYPATNAGWNVILIPLQEEIVRKVRPAIILLFCSVALLLLITCANVASLLLARAATRKREYCIRMALGASKFRLAVLSLCESFLLALLGGGLGLIVADWGCNFIFQQGMVRIPRFKEVHLSWEVFAFTAVASSLTAVLCSLSAALQGKDVNVAQTLREEGTSASGSLAGRRLRNALVVGEIAVATPLLIAAFLTVGNFMRLQASSTGFAPENVLTFSLTLPESPAYKNKPQRTNFYEETLSRIESIPTVAAVGAISDLPMTEYDTSLEFSIEGRGPAGPGGKDTAGFRVITPGYFTAIGIPLKHGRAFGSADTEGVENVFIINETLARVNLGGEDPLGRKLKVDRFGRDLVGTIVGVAGDVVDKDLGSEPRPQIYAAYSQIPFSSMFVVVKTKDKPSKLARLIEQKVWEVDRNLPVADIRTMHDRIYGSIAEPRLRTLLLSGFALLALLMATAGVYSVTAYSVSRRRHEIGIRMAIGAGRRSVLTLVLKEALLLAFAGIVIGLGAAAAFERLMSSFVADLGAVSLDAYLGVPIAFLFAAFLASVLPAWKATRVDPIRVLRE